MSEQDHRTKFACSEQNLRARAMSTEIIKSDSEKKSEGPRSDSESDQVIQGS